MTGEHLTGLAGGNMAASSPRILSREHSANTCSWMGTLADFSSASLETSGFSDTSVTAVSVPHSEPAR